MNFRIPVACGLIVLSVVLSGAWAMAQPPAQRAAANPADAKNAAAASVELEDPAVAALLATKPNTPGERLRAAMILADLKHPELARGFLKKVLDANLGPAKLVALRDEVGGDVFTSLGTRNDLQPEGKQLADAVAAAVTSRHQDANQIDKLIKLLANPERYIEGVRGLQEAGDAAIDPLVQVLADPARASEYPGVRAALLELGQPARDALMAVVETAANPKLVVEAIRVLGMSDDPNIAFCLLRPAFAPGVNADVRSAATAALTEKYGRTITPGDAVATLLRVACRKKAAANFEFGKFAVWQWDGAEKRCVVTMASPHEAARALAARWVRDAYAIAADNPQVRRLYLLTVLESAAYAAGLGNSIDESSPVASEASKFGVGPVEEALKDAMADKRWAAATVAAQLLGKLGKPSDLLQRSAEPSPLVVAAQSDNRRLRMAAIAAIVRLQPTAMFAGASYVPQGLAFFAGSSGNRRALVACPNVAEARELAGFLAGAGLQTDSFSNGRDLLVQASKSSDYELALIDMAIDRPVVAILLQQLRHDPRTAGLRVGLIARDGYFEKAQQLAESDRLTIALPRPHDDQAIQFDLEQLGKLAPEEFVGFEERQRHAVRALDLLAELSRSSQRVYDLRGVQPALLVAAYNPTLAGHAVPVLARMTSAECQRALVDIASRLELPLAVRQSAGAAFRENVQRNGILLTTDEIRQQYRRYNDSEKQDRGTQKVLSLILDSLEASGPVKK